MEYSLKSLMEDGNRYLKCFQLFRERSSEQQCMQNFIRGILSDILGSIGNGNGSLNVMGVGSGAGDLDVEMFSQLRLKHPGVSVHSEVVEPSSEMLENYKDLVSKTPGLEFVNFSWNKMTASEFEKHWREKKLTKKMDFIHMIQMLYYINDPGASISFFRSLLNKNGKLLIILVSAQSGWGKLWNYKMQMCHTDISQCVTIGDIKCYLDSMGIKNTSYELHSQMDITECFTEGDEKGELLLDFLSEVLDFSKNAPPDLRSGLLEILRHPDCSTEVDGRVIFNNNLGVLVLDP
ncbi:histamine N-methyltransferase-like [Megalops cyprinoides]|uniref:histamine N-methyltransferase-like n=1 Tax=Megalops cyprinoides TaxID=118141 RepID=UPI00186430A4|nr:histamine N-methyltransferase-like [Megalops cyprinoides]